MTLLRRYLPGHGLLLVSLFLIVLAMIGAELALPWIVARLIDQALARAPLSVLQWLAVLFLVTGAALGGLRLLQAYLAERLAMNATNRLRVDLTEHCLGLDSTFHQRFRQGELVERIDGDVAALGRFLSTMLVVVVGNVLLLVGILVTLFVIDWRLGVVMTACVAVIGGVIQALRDRATPLWQAAMEADAQQSGFVGEHLRAAEDIHTSGAVRYSMRGFGELAATVLYRRRRAEVRSSGLYRVTEMLFATTMALVLGVGAWLVLQGQVTVGVLFLVYRYSDLLGYPIHRLSEELNELQRAGAAAARVTELLEWRSTLRDGSHPPPPAGPCPVEFDHVWFGYDPDRPVLRDVTFRLEPGIRLGVVGRTGAGKSTIARLLIRLQDPQRGAIRLAGVDLRDMRLRDVRACVGLVTQDVQIMHGTARDNLTVFDDTIGDERIRAVLTDLGLDWWLEWLPDGLDTVIRPGDAGLSAGQAQLLALARVFLRDPRLILFDEATSRVDADTERTLERVIDRLLAGRTAVVIAHRPETVQRTDQVLVLDHGEVVEFGDRAALAADPGSRLAAMLAAGAWEVAQ